MTNFITNSGAENLKKRLVELIKKSEELKFLVGFFYFSGIKELYKSLKDNPEAKIKVLVGLNVDKTNAGLVEFGDKDSQLSDDERTYKFFQSVKKSLNSDDFDTKEFYEQVKYFVNLIVDDRLQIRKTYNPNHAKIYIFKLDETQIGRKKLFITGSSNLTRSGLTTQEEFNVEISDYGFEDTEKYFDELWETAVIITEEDMAKRKLLEIIEDETLVKEITPYEAYVLVLKIYLDSFKQKEIGESLERVLEENGYKPYKYQLDAVQQALAIIEDNNGVIIADVVGLGKTIVACAVGLELRKRGLILCPPGLVGDKNKTTGWKKYTEDFRLYDWEVRSSGDLENVAKYVKNAKDLEVVIIDEAHRFRNQDTKDYEYLKNICRDKIVILLTATPFNNRPSDILSLLKLFITPKKSSITLEDNLVNKFTTFKWIFHRLGYIKKNWNSNSEDKRKKANNYYEGLFENLPIDLTRVKQRSKYLAKQIRDVIEPVTIRRNRLDLQNNPYYKEEVKDLSTIVDPQEWFFELTEKQSDFYDDIIKVYFGDLEEGGLFKGAIYRPFEYDLDKEKIGKEKLTEKENFQYQQQRNLFDFMRRLVVKRFESSFGSFEQTIRNFIRINKNVLKFIDKTHKYILDRSLLERIYLMDLETIEKYLDEYIDKILKGEYPKNHKIYKVNEFLYKDEFISDIESDLSLLTRILSNLGTLDLVKFDPKSDCLVKNIKKEFARKHKEVESKRKIIIFSEYLDTVKYLKPILQTHFGEKLLVVDRDLTASKIKIINENFDAALELQSDDYDILLSSDKISEGFNLNRAGMVINYDIPWNPVRVIQRVGRINRISKKVFDELFIVNFFPTVKGAELVKSREIASNKMFLIHATLGEDAKIFDIDEEPSASGLFKKIQQNPDEYKEESFYTKILKLYLEIEKKNATLIEDLNKFPPRIKTAKHADDHELFVFIKKGRLYINNINGSNAAVVHQTTFEDVFDRIHCDQSEPKIELSNKFWDNYEKVKKYKGTRNVSVSERSIEQQALNILKSFIAKPWNELLPYLDFLRTLREDIIDYGTLSDYTIRRISNLDGSNEQKQVVSIIDIKTMLDELGDDYLEKEKQKQRKLSKEVIIAIENHNNE